MNEKKKRPRPGRQYPPFYERFVPLALAIIVIVIAVLLIIVLSAALGLFPGS